MNEITNLTLYRHNNAWVYDDPRFGKVAEPLVLGASEMLDDIIILDKGALTREPVEVLFSHKPFPGAHSGERLRGEADGTWYTFQGEEAWLCAALFDYFTTAPEKLYVRCA
jgi:hypothetical protein